MALLETKNLHTYFKTRRGIVKAVNGVSYSIEPGKTLGIVGESGSGKSVSAMSILKLLDDPDFARRCGRNARKRAQATHSPEQNSQTMLDIYQSILAL